MSCSPIGHSNLANISSEDLRKRSEERLNGTRERYNGILAPLGTKQDRCSTLSSPASRTKSSILATI